MMKPLEKAKQHFANKYLAFEQNLNGHKGKGIHGLQRASFDAFRALEFPGRRNEDYKYSPVTKILNPAYELAETFEITEDFVKSRSIAETDSILLVFANGQLVPELSTTDPERDGLRMVSLEEAMADNFLSKSVETIWDQLLVEDQDIFLSLNGALAKSGWLIHVAPGKVIDKPIYLLQVNSSGSEPSIVQNQLLIHSERNSFLKVIQHYVSIDGSNENQFINNLNAFKVDANAQLTQFNIQETGETFILNNSRISQARDSRFTSNVSDTGGKWVRNNLYVSLEDSNTETNLKGVYLADDRQHVDNQTFIDHAFPHCVSNEHYKGIIDGRAEGVFNGKVIVRPDAQKTNAFQQNATLVLSDTAKMNSKPQLEIFADDVRCSHGATSGQLDAEALFYLRARGLDFETSRSMLQFGFLQEIIDDFNFDPIQTHVEQVIHQKLDKG